MDDYDPTVELQNGLGWILHIFIALPLTVLSALALAGSFSMIVSPSKTVIDWFFILLMMFIGGVGIIAGPKTVWSLLRQRGRVVIAADHKKICFPVDRSRTFQWIEIKELSLVPIGRRLFLRIELFVTPTISWWRRIYRWPVGGDYMVPVDLLDTSKLNKLADWHRKTVPGSTS